MGPGNSPNSDTATLTVRAVRGGVAWTYRIEAGRRERHKGNTYVGYPDVAPDK